LDPACIELSIDLQNGGDRLGAGRYISPCRLAESVKRRLRQPERRQEVSTNTLGKHTAGKWQDANLNIALEQCSKALFLVPRDVIDHPRPEALEIAFECPHLEPLCVDRMNGRLLRAHIGHDSRTIAEPLAELFKPRDDPRVMDSRAERFGGKD